MSKVRAAAPLLVLLLLALAPVFYDLGGPWLWDDEADTAVFARRILATGMPTAWDGRIFLDADYGLRVAPHALGRDLLMVGTPWLPYYATAASFALLGTGNAAARLPFALAAWATIALLYGFVQSVTGSRRAAFAAAVLLLASAQFLLYARESRSYAPGMLLTVALLWSFVLLQGEGSDGGTEGPGASARAWPRVAFVAAALLLFHTQIMPAAIALATCGALALLSRRFRSRLGALLRLAPWVVLGTLPWLLLTWSETHTNWQQVQGARDWIQRVLQLGAESTVAVPWLGWLAGLLLLRHRFARGERDLLAIGLAFVALAFALQPPVLSQAALFVSGIRYACGLLPVAAAVSGVIVARASEGRPLRYAALLALFAATHLADNALPWLAFGQSGRLGASGPFISVPRALGEKLANLEWWTFVRGLGTPDPGTLPQLAAFVNERTGREDVVVTNFGWDGLAFYTDRRQGYRISPDVPAVREAAQRLGLPSYTTSLDGVDWLVWRHAAAPLPGLSFEAARAQLEERGARLEPVSRFREVLWENRPELHWHRFPRVGFPFAPRALGPDGVVNADAVVYRVVWPAGTQDPAPAAQAAPD